MSTNTTRRGVAQAMTEETLSTSKRPTINMRTSIATAPTQICQPNAWFRLEPAPANMTKPTENIHATADQSMTNAAGFQVTL